MGLSLDWSREVATCDPAYYKHQQRMFLDFLKAGLVERKQSKVNWDPVDMTVLANEQVIDGRGWRSGALGRAARADPVVLQDHRLSEDLLDALDKLDRWPEKVRLMQKNWIGRSEGLHVRFALDPKTTPSGESELEIFTTRPDTLVRREVRGDRAGSSAGAGGGGEESRSSRRSSPSASATAPRRPRSTPRRSSASTPASRRCIRSIANWTLPVYVANFMLMDYGTGAIFGCPAHDQRDLDFANKYGLGNMPVVCPPGQDPKTFVITDTPMSATARMINSRFLDGMTHRAGEGRSGEAA